MSAAASPAVRQNQNDCGLSASTGSPLPVGSGDSAALAPVCIDSGYAIAQQIDERVAAAVRQGLVSRRKRLPPWLFYDEAGSQLFEAIAELPEYYLTRTERGILLANAAAIISGRSAAQAAAPRRQTARVCASRSWAQARPRRLASCSRPLSNGSERSTTNR